MSQSKRTQPKDSLSQKSSLFTNYVYLIRLCWGEYLNLNDRKENYTGEERVIRGFISCNLHKILIWLLNNGGRDYRCMQKECKPQEQNVSRKSRERPRHSWKDEILMGIIWTAEGTKHRIKHDSTLCGCCTFYFNIGNVNNAFIRL